MPARALGIALATLVALSPASAVEAQSLLHEVEITVNSDGTL